MKTKNIVKGIMLLTMILVLTGAASALTGIVTRNASVFKNDTAVGNVQWVNPGNAQYSDNSYATASLSNSGTQDSYYLNATGFGFNIPSGSTIQGIVVNVERYTTGSTTAINDNSVVLYNNGVRTVTDKASNSDWGSSDAIASYGGSGDLWSASWAATDINNAKFGVAFSAHHHQSVSGTHSANVDHINVTVYYSDTTEPTVSTVDSDGKTFNSATSSPQTIKVTFNEEMSTAPSISISTGGSQTVNDCGDSDTKTYCFAYSIPSATDKTTMTLTISGAKDWAGNAMASNTAHTFIVDTKAPTVDAGADKTTKALFTQTGTATDASTMTYSWTKVSGPGTITFGTATSLSTTITASVEGTYVIQLAATDAAGNVASDTMTLIWDQTAPVISATAPATNARINSQIVNYTLTESNTIAAASIVFTRSVGTADTNSPHNCTLQGTANTSGAHNNLVLATGQNACVNWAYPLVDGTNYAVTFDATDAAGNPATRNTTTGVAYDKTAPTLSPVHIVSNNANTAWAKVGDTITLTFTSSESIQTPIVTIATHSATVSGGPTSWTATYVMASGDTEGAVALNIAFSDLAGNAGTAVTATTDSSSVKFDRTAPTTSDNSDPTVHVPTYTVTLTESDNFGTPGTISTVYCIDTTGACVPGTSIDSGQTVSFTSSNRGVNHLRYYSTDAAGNIQATQDKTININQRPVFTNAVDDAAYIPGGSTVTITSTASDADSGQTLKLYVCKGMDATSAGCGAAGTYCSDTSHSANPTCSFASETDTDHHHWYAYIFDSLNEGSDTNGRTGDYYTDSAAPTLSLGVNPAVLSYDNTGPTVDIANVGACSDVGSGMSAYQVSYSDAGASADSNCADNSYVVASAWGGSHAVSFTGTDGHYYCIKLECRDVAGNTASFYSANNILFDISAPTLSPVQIASSNTNHAKAKVGDTVSLTFSASESINSPSVLIAGHGVTASGSGSGPYTASYVMTPGDAEGVVTFTISGYSDSAGNAGSPKTSSTDASSVTFDKTGPVVTVPSDNTAEATGSSGAVVSFTSSALDALDGPITSACLPVSGSTFALGDTTVTCSATDSAGNQGSNTFKITVHDTTAPQISGTPSDMTVEATSSSGAVGTFTSPTSSDLVDGSVTVSCSPVSGSTFALGETTVTCSATDSHSNTATTTFKVKVQDKTAPLIASHVDETAEATSASGAAVSYTSPATSDAVDGAGTATCLPASGSTFALGDTTVYCDAVDAAGNHAIQTHFKVTVQDTTKPLIAAHGDETAEATSSAGAIVSYTSPSTSDAVDGPGTASCSPISGSLFVLGDTTVTCTAADKATNAATPLTFNVKVQDKTAPSIDYPSDVIAEATSSAGAVVSYSSPATHDAVDGDKTASCLPASGSSFALGDSIVTCSATDAAGNAATPKTFKITVKDTTAPVIAAHGDETAEATSAAGAAVSYSSPATSDAVDGAGTATCLPVSGSTFALGDTQVLCDAKDAAGNNAVQTSFKVTVQDKTKPVIAAHDSVTEEATAASGATVTYISPATSDAVDGAGVATCLPASGSTFALGATTVTCNAMDAHSNAAAPTTFKVTVADTTAPTLTITGASADGNGMGGDLATGYILTTHNFQEDAKSHVLAFSATSTASEALAGLTGLYIDTVGLDTAGLTAYYNTRPLPDAYRAYLISALDGATKPFAYITTDSSNNLVLHDAAQYDAGNHDIGMVIPDNYPLGTYKVKGTAKDAAGNPVDIVLILIVAGDRTEPVISIVQPDSSAAKTKTITASADKGTLLMSVDAGSTCDGTLSFVPYDSTSFNAEADNGKTICYEATLMSADNLVTYKLSAPISGIDTSAPSVAITAPSAGAKVKGTEAISFTDSEQTTPQCSVDNTHWQYCISATSLISSLPGFSSLSQGSFTLYLRDTDAAGNTGRDSISLTKDTAAPTVTAVDSDGKTFNLATSSPQKIKVTFSEDIVNTPTIEVHSVPVFPQTVTDCGDSDAKTFCFDYAIPAQQKTTHTIYITGAQDAAGNIMIEDHTHTFTVDRIAPTLSPVHIATDNANYHMAKAGDTITVSFTASESIQAPTVTIATNPATVSGGPTAWSASYMLSSADSDGTVAFNIAFSDPAGNAGTAVTATTDGSSITFDKTAPVLGPVTIAPNSAGFISGSSTISATVTEAVGVDATSCQYTLNGINWITAGSYASGACTFTGVDTSSATSIDVLVMDLAGNTGSGSAVAVTADTAAPTTSDDAPTAWRNGDATVTLTPSDGSGSGIASTKYCIYNVEESACTPNTEGTSVTVACVAGSTCRQIVRYYSTDALNNAETAHDSGTIQIDKTAPGLVSLNLPGGNGPLTGTVEIDADVSDGGSGIAKVGFYHSSAIATLIGEDDSYPYSIKWDTTDSVDGTHSIDVVVYDNVGNSQSLGSVEVNVQNCGNGIVSSLEKCDDGNLAAGDGCSATCTIETGYSCTGSPSTCAPICGDGLVTGGEACDDSNTDSGDGCSATCSIETGFSCSGSPSVCSGICGDGLIKGTESCDDSDTAASDGCSASCGIESGWQCAGTPSVCAPICGDGIKTGNEQCDDGNVISGDGCSSTCKVESTFYHDGDGDGFGDAADSIKAVEAPANYVSDSTDCDDTKATVHPGATETCNGLDDNCDGSIDENLGTIPADNVQGACKDNIKECVAGVWTNKVGNYVPTADDKTCDGIDNNCNGQIDEGYVSDNSCFKPGICAAGNVASSCVADHETACQTGTPSTEVCNGLDDNCDGSVDEDLGTIPADNVLGACSNNVKECIAGVWTNRVGNYIPAADDKTCDGVDNNCNGQVDEGYVPDTSCFKPGVCASGDVASSCVAGHETACQTGTPSAEVCNGLDDNCDGQIDEGFDLGASCTGDQNNCGLTASGTKVCAADGLSAVCNAAKPADVQGLGVSCTSGANNCGLTASGSMVCAADKLTTECNAVKPADGVISTFYQDLDSDGYGNSAVSIQACAAPAGYVADSTDCNDADAAIHPGADDSKCNNVDEDCSGTADDHFVQQDTTCGVGACAATGHTVCYAGGIPHNTCIDNQAKPSAETCNGIDDDCNGLVDDGLTAPSQACTVGVGACQRSGTQYKTCEGISGWSADYGACSATPGEPSTETCNGLDDDCNGAIDNGFDLGGICSVGKGVCQSSGVLVCKADGTGTKCSAVEGTPTAEVCNGLDDNCDGNIDEGFNVGASCDSAPNSCNDKNTGNLVCSSNGLGTECSATKPPERSNWNQACNSEANHCGSTNAGVTDCNGVCLAQKPADPAGYGDACESASNSCGASAKGTIQCDGTCSAVTPAENKITYYRDADGDGYGNALDSVQACSTPNGYVSDSTDCDDTKSAVNPGVTEVCNGVDDNCDGKIDENNVCGTTNYYCDGDKDGHYSIASSGSCDTNNCIPAGCQANAGDDCNDADAAVYPGATELCNGVDDNCNGQVDDGLSAPSQACSVGVGACERTGTQVKTCNGVNGWSDFGSCSATAGTPAAESCNGLDDDCDGLIDEGGVCTAVECPAGTVKQFKETLSVDSVSATGATSSSALDSGKAYLLEASGTWANGNLNKADAEYASTDSWATHMDGYNINPYLLGEGEFDLQVDGSFVNWGAYNAAHQYSYAYTGTGSTVSFRVFDGDSTKGPAAQEPGWYGDNTGSLSVDIYYCAPEAVCGDGIVNGAEACDDGNTAAGDGCSATCTVESGWQCTGTLSTCNAVCGDGIIVAGQETCDGNSQACTADGGLAGTQTCNAQCNGWNTCTATPICGDGIVSGAEACDDGNTAAGDGCSATCTVEPGWQCTGTAPSACCLQSTYFQDSDGDGYGNVAVTKTACSKPEGYVLDSTDCDDTNGLIHPGAAELCNGIDDNCNGLTDEGLTTKPADNVKGLCAGNVKTCTGVGGWQDAATNYVPKAEVCDGSADENCDGTVDEGCQCVSGATQQCGASNVGECKYGLSTCVDGVWSSCVGNVDPVQETCDGKDNNCDGKIDEGVKSTFYQDSDGDGFGNAAVSVEACSAPVGYVSDGTDCNDARADIHPTATEVCNGVDDNCDGKIDENNVCGSTNYYCDGDKDGHFSIASSGSCDTNNCIPAGCRANAGDDCNDANAAVYPGATEVCNGIDDNCNGQIDENLGTQPADNIKGACSGNVKVCTDGKWADKSDNYVPSAETCNGIDDNCDGQVDENNVCSTTNYYCDGDSDGHFSAVASGSCNTNNCIPAGCQATAGDDCNDANAAVHPGAAEVCNGVDDNCNGQTDEGVKTTYYHDVDNDGYGNAADPTQACSAPSGYVIDSTDCNDANAAVHPGAKEVCNQIDDNCNGQVDEGSVCPKTYTYYCDSDHDGYRSLTPTGICTGTNCAPKGCSTTAGSDCDDTKAAVHPGAKEVCNGIDDDCNANTADGSGESWFNRGTTCGVGACAATGKWTCSSGVKTNTCTAGAPKAETCNGIDDNCNGQTDEGVKNIYYRDADSDTYGNLAVSTQACTAPKGYVTDNTDCNDNNKNVYPGATEVCNGIDDNCNGQIDENNVCSAPVKCWSAGNQFLYTSSDQAKKFCLCASGTYGYQSYTQASGIKTSYGYTNDENNNKWAVKSYISTRPINGVKCSNGQTYSTNQDYYR